MMSNMAVNRVATKVNAILRLPFAIENQQRGHA